MTGAPNRPALSPTDTAHVGATAGRDGQPPTPPTPRTATRRRGRRAAPRRAPALEPVLPIKIRTDTGEIKVLGLPAERHRRLHLGLLHSASDGYVEIAAGTRLQTGKLALVSRKDPGTFLPGGATGQARWLHGLLALAEQHIAQDKEVCVAAAVRHDRAGAKSAVSHTNWLWLDVDGPEGLPALKRLLRRKPPHLVVESAGSGGMHTYWRLDTPLHAIAANADLAWLTDKGSGDDVIERAHERIIYALGYRWQHGRPVPTVADAACKDRSRVMRLPGTINGKTGRHARIVWADLALRPWPLQALAGDLPDPPTPRATRRRAAAPGRHDDPYKQIAPAVYFRRLAGIDVPDHGLVSCPSPTHRDQTPSCHVGTRSDEGWNCFACDAAGAIYDLASVLLGGPTGRWLRGQQFAAARDLVRETFGEP